MLRGLRERSMGGDSLATKPVSRPSLYVRASYPNYRNEDGVVEWLDHRFVGQTGMFIVRPIADIGWMTGGKLYNVNYWRDEPPAEPGDVLPVSFEWSTPLVKSAGNPFGYEYSKDGDQRDWFEYWVTLYRSREALDEHLRQIATRLQRSDSDGPQGRCGIVRERFVKAQANTATRSLSVHSAPSK